MKPDIKDFSNKNWFADYIYPLVEKATPAGKDDADVTLFSELLCKKFDNVVMREKPTQYPDFTYREWEFPVGDVMIRLDTWYNKAGEISGRIHCYSI